MKLIVNADDYGFDCNRTMAICECFNRGLIGQTTLMVNMPWCERAVQMAREKGFIRKVGLHFNLTKGRAMSDEMRQNRTFCDESGCFTGDFHRSRIHRFWLGIRDRRAVAAEARAQLEAYLNLGLPLMHLDSHHHVHTDPSIAGILLPIAREKGFRTVRISRNLPVSPSLVKRIYKNRYRKVLHRFGFETSDWLGGLTELLQAHDMSGVVEIMVHPLFYFPDMDFDCEYADAKGELSDSKTPIGRLAEALGNLRSGCYGDVCA